MKPTLAIFLFAGLIGHSALGQGAQADQVKRRAKETVNQNNVRQGGPAPAQNQVPAASAPPTANSVSQAQSLTRLKSDLAVLKTGHTATAQQKQKLTVNLLYAARGPKPALTTIQTFVASLTTALTGATLTAETQTRLAQNLEAVCNAKPLSVAQFDKIIEDTQAILEVGTVKRATAVSVAANLKAMGAEVRR